MRVNLTSTESGQQAQAKKADAQRLFEAIRGNDRLSPEGKRERLAQEWWSHRKELKALEHGQLEARRDRRDVLHRSLFAGTAYPTGSDIISQRDAADRAARLSSPDEAEALIRQARRNSDAALAKAIAQHAFEQKWTTVLDEWIDGNQVLEDQVNELFTLTAQSAQADAALLFQHAMTYELEKPDEVARMTHGELDAAVGESTAMHGHQPASVATNLGASDRRADYQSTDAWTLSSALSGSDS